jgi:oxygen-independent coproporphyrinogen-3 oxidase
MTKNGKQAVNHRQRNVETDYQNGKQGLYIHWPYCVVKCPYCDFNSHVARVFSEADYVDAIAQELAYMQAQTDEHRLTSVFIGGGTPSLMAPDTLAEILGHVRRLFQIEETAEITMEANPSSSEAEKFQAFAAAGVNRLSLGVQSFDEEALRVLGRPHNSQEALQAIELARQTFERISFDMIFARHRQDLDAWRQELRQAVALSAGHLSAYQLTIEPGTRYHGLFRSGELDLAAGEEAQVFLAETRALLSDAGLAAYEVSNFARPGEECRHNLGYWRYQPYIGVGPGAHGRIVSNGCRLATSTLRSPARWLQQVRDRGHGLESRQTLSLLEQADERLLMGLRLKEGIDLAQLRAETGYEPSKSKLEELCGLGLCAFDAATGVLMMTEAGLPMLNPVIAELSTSMQPNAANLL